MFDANTMQKRMKCVGTLMGQVLDMATNLIYSSQNQHTIQIITHCSVVRQQEAMSQKQALLCIGHRGRGNRVNARDPKAVLLDHLTN